MSGARVRAVIFDFDYTLADSSSGVIACANYALAAMGLPAAADDAIRRTIGMSLPRTLAALAGDEYAPRGDEFMRLFLERADEVMADSTRVYDFVPRLADDLDGLGVEMGIVSSKYRHRIEEVLRREGLASRFAAIVGAEDVAELKPDPTGLLRAVDLLSGCRARCLYAGDSATDAETARRAGVAFVATLSGVTPRDAFADYAPRLHIDSAAELPPLLASGVL